MKTESVFDVGIALRPRPGKNVCGDQAASWSLNPHLCLAALVDGLGHGKAAHDAAEHCLTTIQAHCEQPLAIIVEHCHRRLLSTRGAALALACLDAMSYRVEVVSIGNIATVLVGGHRRRLLPTPGIVGHQAAKPPAVQSAEFVPGRDLLFMTSDGIDETLELEPFGRRLFPSLQGLAEMTLQRGAMPHDDASVLVVG